MSSEDCDTLAATALLEEFYTRVYASGDKLQHEIGVTISEAKLQEIVSELKNEVNALRAETEMLEYQASLQPPQRHGGRHAESNLQNSDSSTLVPLAGDEEKHFATAFSSGILAGSMQLNIDDITGIPVAVKVPQTASPLKVEAASGGTAPTAARRGKKYQRKIDGSVGRYVSVTDKTAMLMKEEERFLAIEKGDEAAAEKIRELLIATVEEAARRAKELRLERKLFARDVLNSDNPELWEDAALSSIAETGASAEELLHYIEHRRTSCESYLDKLKMQCSAAEQDIARATRQLRQHQAASEAFRPVDFEQLGIENEQFNERAEQKSAELVELKGASTRTVQALNATTDALNDLVAEQNQLKKEYKSRCEYLARCSKEMSSVEKEAIAAEKKNEAIRAKYESVKVPTIEEYIAQRAELFELRKAEKNWLRKVEIAQGQTRGLCQKVRQLTAQRDAAMAYATERQNQRAINLKAESLRWKSASSKNQPRPPSPPSHVVATTTTAPAAGTAPVSDERIIPIHNTPLVANSKSLLNAKRRLRE